MANTFPRAAAVPAFPRTNWTPMLADLRRDAYSDEAASEEIIYSRGERAYWMAAVMTALANSENAIVIAHAELAMRDAELRAMEARIQFLERYIEEQGKKQA